MHVGCRSQQEAVGDQAEHQVQAEERSNQPVDGIGDMSLHSTNWIQERGPLLHASCFNWFLRHRTTTIRSLLNSMQAVHLACQGWQEPHNTDGRWDHVQCHVLFLGLAVLRQSAKTRFGDARKAQLKGDL